MRVLLVAALLLGLLFAGCLGEEEETDPLLGVCPQWRPGSWSETATVTLDGSTTTHGVSLAPVEGDGGALALGDWPVDQYRIHFDDLEVQGAVLRLHAYGEGTEPLAIYDFREPRVQVLPSLALGPNGAAVGHTFQVTLSAVEHGADPEPAPLRLEWRLEPSGDAPNATATVTVTALYKVCGTPL